MTYSELIAGLATIAFVHWVWCKVSYYLMLMPDKKKKPYKGDKE